MENLILVPMDFTKVSKTKALVADELAQERGAKLLFMHAVAMEDQLSHYTWSYDRSNSHENYVKQMKKRLEGFIHSFDVRSSYECEVRTGTPYLQILEMQEESYARMIMMSAHDHTILGRLFLGGNTSYVLHHAKCPVYIYKEHEEELSNNIIVPIGFTDVDKFIVHQADEWAQKEGATLHFVHADPLVPPIVFHEDMMPLMYPDTSHTQQSFEQEGQSNSYRQRMDEIVDQLAIKLQGFINFCMVKSPHQCHLKMGKAYLEILSLQEELKAKLVMMSAHDHTILGRVLRGSTSDYVLNHAKCPIYVHKAIE